MTGGFGGVEGEGGGVGGADGGVGGDGVAPAGGVIGGGGPPAGAPDGGVCPGTEFSLVGSSLITQGDPRQKAGARQTLQCDQ